MSFPSHTGGGKLRETISVERRSQPSAYTTSAAPVGASWSPLLTGLRARVSPVKGGEEVQASRLTGTAQVYVTVRSDSSTRSITTADRIVWSGVTYNVRWIANLDERNRYLTILAESGVAT